ncbi:potassium channel family protein [Acetobacter sp. AN02]|uniref:potassium channel family protein n=1 Tax=Acetobacter sp. AN02 TaxID=2894186 RepID=UPI0038D228A9
MRFFYRKNEEISLFSVIYIIIISIQVVSILLYSLNLVSKEISIFVGITTSLASPILSLVVGTRLFTKHNPPKIVASFFTFITYLFTCISFAIIYIILNDNMYHPFSIPSSEKYFSLPIAIYFSIITITTTGYGDIYPTADLSRLVVGCEIFTGMIYQFSIFSLLTTFIESSKSNH